MKKITFGIALTAAVIATGCWDASDNRSANSDAVNYAPQSTPAVKRSPERTANSENTNSANTVAPTPSGFTANLPAGFQQPSDSVGTTLLKAYGAVFVARGGVKPPPKVMFRDEAEVSAFQATLQTSTVSVGGVSLELQTPAAEALKKAIDDARSKGLSISPRGADSAKRTYSETVGLWNERVQPALQHWLSNGRIDKAAADRINGLSTADQVSEVLKLEENGIYFAKDMKKSILYSSAPPGTSQHLALLALDVKEFDNPKVREVLAAHGWFQTVVSDLPHFTFLGVKESELNSLGLRQETKDGRKFWVPDI